MAGFMSPSLGFTSTIGAFIGGAARKGTELLDREAELDEQYNKIWIAKFADGLKEYDKEVANQKKEKGAYDYVKSTTGSGKLADAALNAYRADPKIDLTKWITDYQANNPGGAPAGPGELEGSINEGVQRKSSILDQIRGQVTDPRARNTMIMPQVNQVGQTMQYPSQVAATSKPASQGMSPNVSPSSVPSKSTPSQLDTSPEAMNAPASPGNAPIPLDSSPKVKEGIVTDSNDPRFGFPATSETTPSTATGSPYPMNFGGGRMPPGMPDPGKYVDQDAYFKALKSWNPALSDTRAREMANSSMTADKAGEQKIREAEARAGAPRPFDTEFSKRLADRIDKLPTPDGRVLSSVNTVINLIENNQLKTGGPIQQFMDSINRMSYPLGFDISKYTKGLQGIEPNNPANADTVNKITRDLVMDFLRTANLAPVSNYENAMIERAVTNVGTNPKANLFIAVYMQEKMKRNGMMRDAAARLVQDNWNQKDAAPKINAELNKLEQWDRENPYILQVNSAVMSPEERIRVFNSIPSGTWFIDLARDGVDGLARKP